MTSRRGGGKGVVQQVNNQGDVNGFAGNGPGSKELPNGRVDVNNVHDGCNQAVVQGNGAPQGPQQLPQGSLVHWEKFLHVRSIKVMLVENDDCTRHIVTALLRNCNYEVIEAANGFQAWKILENLSNHIDIVLTEVAMPSFSGIALLCKIMSHKTRKNVPVIMMSSHDSMGLVFKCLSKGAVDFLVKPIRKNELKNLWQHVWRRCHSSSGSGSESGTQVQKSVNSKSNIRYDNSGSKDGDDNESTDGGSVDGSGTQSSWTKQAVECESPEAASLNDQIAENPDSTCGLVIPPTRVSNNQEGEPYDGGTGKEIAMCRSRNSEMQIEFPFEVPIKRNAIEQNTHQVFDPILNVKSKDAGFLDSKMPDPQMVKGGIEGQQGEPEKPMDANTEDIDDSDEIIVGELGLKRARATENEGREAQNGYNNWRHSELSAFTRYKTNSNSVKGAPGITGCHSQPENSSNVVKKDFKRNAHSDGYLIYQGSSEQVIPRKADDITPANMLQQELRVQHIHHHHHVHHYHNIDTEQPLSNEDNCGLNSLAADATHCGSSNIMGGRVEGNLENYSMNRSASGSKHGSNVPNGSNTGVNFEVPNVEGNVDIDVKSGNGDASGSGSRNGTDHNRKSALREAALSKFRQKREVRCFQKKVRYQNRKKLAEQRPRVRGQFVKGTGRDNSVNAADG